MGPSMNTKASGPPLDLCGWAPRVHWWRQNCHRWWSHLSRKAQKHSAKSSFAGLGANARLKEMDQSGLGLPVGYDLICGATGDLVVVEWLEQ